MQTNATISIYKSSKNWKHVETTSHLGDFDVWLEQVSQREFKSYEGSNVSEKVGDGLAIIMDEIDLTNTYWLDSAGNRHHFKDWDTFLDDDGTFHHIEAIYG